MAKHAISDFDLFYLSFDEPQKEEFWAKIKDIAPWAQRVDGVKGFDSAHKACANLSQTDRFITIDGDNIVDPSFFDLILDIPDHLNDASLSWGARNSINGLCYGNGGLKLWTKDFVLGMKTHENAEKSEETVDFCWDNKYVQMNNIYSTTCPNGSAYQAFRAGFREGVKMTLDRGVKPGGGVLHGKIHSKNFKRLLVWASIGADVPNGQWAIYGTRAGIYEGNLNPDFDIAKISDYEWFKKYFQDQHSTLDPVREATLLLPILQKTLGLNIADMSADQSKFFKSVYEAPARVDNAIFTEMEADGQNH